jgi:hypothetical protein
MIFLVVIVSSIIVSLYFSTWRDLWRPVITVNGESVNMDYLIRRMKYVDMTDDVLMMVYEVIPYEMLIRQRAPYYGIEVTEEEIDDMLRENARGQNENVTELEFKTWYRNVLNETRLSDAEYRELVLTIMLTERLNEYLVENIPTVAEQIHLYVIILPSYDEAEAAIARIEAGEEFSNVAMELSLDEETGKQGGDTGWWPEGTLQSALEGAAFRLEVGQISTPILIDDVEQLYTVCMVAERQLVCEIEEDKLELLKNGVLEEWINSEMSNNTILFGGMDWSDLEQRYVVGSKTIAWINLQLAKE